MYGYPEILPLPSNIEWIHIMRFPFFPIGVLDFCPLHVEIVTIRDDNDFSQM